MMEELNKQLIQIYENSIHRGAVTHFPNSITIDNVEVELLNPINYSDIKLVSSPFGLGRERVVDEVYRKSKEFKFNEAVDRRIISLGQKIVDQVLSRPTYISIPYKLIVYEEGDFFNKHTDTPEKDLEYTLVVILNTEYKGGEFMFGDFDATKGFKNGKLHFILFNIEKPHHVNKVISGKRIALTYKVYKTEKIAVKSNEHHLSDKIIDVPIKKKNILISFPCIRKLQSALCNYNCKVVYGGEQRPRVVYESFNENMQDGYFNSGTMEFDNYIEDNTPMYYVSEIIEYEYEKMPKSSFQDTRYLGNSPEAEDYDVNYYTFLLINPRGSREKSSSSDDEEDVPVTKKKAIPRRSKAKEENSTSDDEENVPLAKRKL